MEDVVEFRSENRAGLHVLTVDGPGRPVVLVHSVTSHAHSWLPVAARLDRRIVCPDLRGHGFSPWPEAGYRPADHAADVVALCRELGPVDLVAPSLGGRIAVLAAAALEEGVGTLVLLDSAPSLPTAATARISATRASTGRRTAFATQDEVAAFWAAQHPTWTEEACAVRARYLYHRDAAGHLVSRNDPAAVEAIFGSDEGPAVWAALAEISARTLVVRGRDSPLLDRETAERVVAALPAGELREVLGGHYLPYERPEAVAGLIQGV